MKTDVSDSYESLMQFLYQAPIGLVRTALDGTVDIINPMSARLLLPIASNGDLDNLFVVLDSLAPQMRQLVSEFDASSGVVLEPTRFDVRHLNRPDTALGVGSGRSVAAAAVSAPAPLTSAPEVLSISLLKLDENWLIAVVTDATLDAQREQQGLDRRLRAAARTDTLTNMPNRSALVDRLGDLLNTRRHDPDQEFAVLFMNCDRFKQINDTLGHQAGDELLGLMADRLRSTLRTSDQLARQIEPLAARIGGDEFVIVLDDLRRADDAHAVAQRLLDILSKPYGIGAQQVYCSVSMGVVLKAQADDDADKLLQDASIAMAEAKRDGGARYVVFEPVMQERALRRSGIEADLRNGLERGELYVVYQPVLALLPNNGIDKAAGVEALVRWRHPTRGTVPPLEFIGIAEECGLIGAVGLFVLASACHQFMIWQRELGAAAPKLLAVNLSRAQLSDPGFSQSVAHVLSASAMKASSLQLEVTESLAAQDETVQARLHELKALGVTLALDDFGTGYSSLASLHTLPVDTVKIDRSFVSQGATSHHHRVLMEATVRVAASLGMGTVAEGIETEAQAEVVRALGCQKAQGYLYAKPLTSPELVAWLHEPSTHRAVNRA